MKIVILSVIALSVQVLALSSHAEASSRCFWNDRDFLTGRSYCIYGLSAVPGINSQEACEDFCASKAAPAVEQFSSQNSDAALEE